MAPFRNSPSVVLQLLQFYTNLTKESRSCNVINGIMEARDAELISLNNESGIYTAFHNNNIKMSTYKDLLTLLLKLGTEI